MVFKTAGSNEVTMGVNVVEKVTTDLITDRYKILEEERQVEKTLKEQPGRQKENKLLLNVEWIKQCGRGGSDKQR